MDKPIELLQERNQLIAALFSPLTRAAAQFMELETTQDNEQQQQTHLALRPRQIGFRMDHA